jgi:hypothetical protein
VLNFSGSNVCIIQDLELTHPGPIGVLGPGRCKRFAMHVVDGVIKAVNVSESADDPVSTKQDVLDFSCLVCNLTLKPLFSRILCQTKDRG